MDTNQDNKQEPAINPSFVKRLNSHFTEYLSDKHAFFRSSGGVSSFELDRKKREFVSAVNKTMQDLARRPSVRADELHPLTTETFSGMLEGKIGLTPELLAVFPHVFKIFGDERETLLELGQQAINDENARRKAVWLATPEGQAEGLAKQVANEAGTQAEAASKLAGERIATHQKTWRKNNPKGMRELPSFQEMLEASHAKGENFGQFLFKRVMPTWENMSQVDFCEHLRTLNEPKGSNLKSTITNTILSTWRLSYGIDTVRKTKKPRTQGTKPLRDSADVICHAFNITPEEGELMARHEKMLWKTIDGHEFSWRDKKGVSAIEEAIKDCKEGGDTGALIQELKSSSGIRFERLQELLKVKQLTQWMKGAKIENTDMALQFLQLVNPQPTEELSKTVSRQNKALLSLLTGREFDIEKILVHANKQGNPGGALFVALTGRNGLLTFISSEMVAHFKAAGLKCTEERIKKMRTATQLQRGGKILEPYAKAILAAIEKSAQHLAERGVYKPFTAEQKERCIETFTGIPHPKKMLQTAVKGELPIGEVVSKTCDRLGLNLSGGDDNFCKQVGISHISDFVLSKSSLESETAEKLVKWFTAHYEFTEQEQQQFITLARGVNLQRTPDNILDEVASGAITRAQGLREIYDYSGLSRPELAMAANVSYHAIRYSTTEISGGRIIADSQAIKRIANECKVSVARINDFIQTFDGNEVSRKAIPGSNVRAGAESWKELAQNSKPRGGWARSAADDGEGDD